MGIEPVEGMNLSTAASEPRCGRPAFHKTVGLPVTVGLPERSVCDRGPVASQGGFFPVSAYLGEIAECCIFIICSTPKVLRTESSRAETGNIWGTHTTQLEALNV